MLRLAAAGSVAGLSLASCLAGQKVKAESLPWQTEATHGPVSLDFSWLLGGATGREEVRPEAGPQRKVLLLAYPRTGICPAFLLASLIDSFCA